mmetsp:Transcript_10260/g.36461  ORF Transcript_10260/g.36461 Transcript_10260/m.36461 type:complete len:535 (+) Transcript_10260:109-1713(+)
MRARVEAKERRPPLFWPLLQDCGLLDLVAVLGGPGAVDGVVIRRATVVGHVQTLMLLLRGNPQDARELHRAEDDAGHAHAPRHDHHASEDVNPELLAATAVEGSAGLRVTVRGGGVDLAAEEASTEQAEEPAAHVDGRSVQRVVDLQLLHADGEPELDTPGHKSDDPASPGLSHGDRGADADQTAQNAVAQGGQIQVAILDEAHADGGDGAARRGEGGSNSDLLGHEDVPVREHERGPGVEPVPPEPQDEGPEADKGGVVGAHGLHVAIGVKPPDPRPEDGGRHKGGAPADHVHDGAPREVNGSGGDPGAVGGVPEGGEPSVGRPDPVHHNGVDEPGDEGRVDDVPEEGAPLGDGAGHDGGRGCGEGPLEEPPREGHDFGLDGPFWGDVQARVRLRVAGSVPLDEEEAVRPDEPVGLAAAVVPAAVREGEPEGPPHEGACGEVHDVLDHQILRVLGSNGSHLEHGEAGLHDEDQERGKQEPQVVHHRGKVRVLDVARQVRRGARQPARQHGVVHRVHTRVPRQEEEEGGFPAGV